MLKEQLAELYEKYPKGDVNIAAMQNQESPTYDKQRKKMTSTSIRFLETIDLMEKAAKDDDFSGFMVHSRDYIGYFERFREQPNLLFSVVRQRQEKDRQDKHNGAVRDLEQKVKKLRSNLQEYTALCQGISEELAKKEKELKKLKGA